ncbi:N-acetyltransferase family protein [Flagellimonas sp. 2504JD1-5]
MHIREMKATDWGQVSQIYQEGIATGFATFEQQTPSYLEWNQAHLEKCRLVVEENGNVIGWAALSPVSSRCVYGGVGEVSVYVAKNARGKGVGRLLLELLIIESEKAGFWTIQSGVFPENEGSIRLHEKVGFRFIGKREKVGKIGGVWKDNLLFERRSTKVGID